MAPAMMRIPLLAALAALFLLASCAGGPKPVVLDYDTYQIVTLGPISYVTPEGVALVARQPGYVDHRLDRLNGAAMRVEVDTNPPSELALDADAARRRFLHRMNRAQSRSSQVASSADLSRVKISADGFGDDGERIYGNLAVLRQRDTTVLLSVVGKWEDRGQIDDFIEAMVPKVSFPGRTVSQTADEYAAAE